jgi:hypothetical protein
LADDHDGYVALFGGVISPKNMDLIPVEKSFNRGKRRVESNASQAALRLL